MMTDSSVLSMRVLLRTSNLSTSSYDEIAEMTESIP